ncbi:TetR/AcrR family transcriptional regulator [Corynebacterium halotolerans]|uniref:HTH tetR-type domain-containing protein n=1 Tax=Corynebacterium halotolerans YIM 70093 = DSM 44683 TaxID=1121362 RepID=M1NQY0_9CORY|nr:TetR/AcrR family transcriptional regulator [Corynebacterium halotolerans]AGF71927.1 hypothetical protein A605_04590 [Corynebacterium halotolerans YIM 70093 = DSM 44683]
MSGLRETKKAATRATLARAAARLALDRGAEGLTVAAVSEAAGVSPRTFHNYFTSMEEALVEFIVDRASSLAEQLNAVPADVGLFEAVEKVVLVGLRRDNGGHGELDSFATLFRIGDVLQTLTGVDARPEFTEHLGPVFETVHPRVSGLDEFGSQVAVNAAVSVARTALETYYSLPEPRDGATGEELVHRAFAVVRLA